MSFLEDEVLPLLPDGPVKQRVQAALDPKHLRIQSATTLGVGESPIHSAGALDLITESRAPLSADLVREVAGGSVANAIAEFRQFVSLSPQPAATTTPAAPIVTAVNQEPPVYRPSEYAVHLYRICAEAGAITEDGRLMSEREAFNRVFDGLIAAKMPPPSNVTWTGGRSRWNAWSYIRNEAPNRRKCANYVRLNIERCTAWFLIHREDKPVIAKSSRKGSKLRLVTT